MNLILGGDAASGVPGIGGGAGIGAGLGSAGGAGGAGGNPAGSIRVT